MRALEDGKMQKIWGLAQFSTGEGRGGRRDDAGGRRKRISRLVLGVCRRSDGPGMAVLGSIGRDGHFW